MYEIINLNRNKIFLIFFVATLILISFGSIGSGWYGNYSVAKYILCFTIISLFLSWNLKFELNKLKTIFILFFFSMIFSNLTSPYLFDIRQWYRFFNIFIVFVFGYSVYLYSKNYQINLFYFFNKTMIVIGLLYVIVYLYAWFSISDPRNYNWVTGLYVFNSIRNFSDFYSIIVVLAIFNLFNKSSYINILILMFIMSLFVWTGTRSAFISVIISTVFLFALFKYKLKNILYLSFILIISVYLSGLFYTNGNAIGVHNSIARTTGGNFSSSRLDLWYGILSLIENRALFGYGGEAVKLSNIGVLSINQNLTQAHNSILQIIIEWGVVGLLCFIFIMFLFLKKIFLEIKIWTIDQIALVGLILNILVVSLFNGAFYYTAIYSMLALCIALYYVISCSRTNRFS